MEAFLTPKQRARQLDRYVRSKNPCPGRKQSENRRISRALVRIRERLDYWLEETDFRDMPWLPSDGIVSRLDEDYLRSSYEAYLDGVPDPDDYFFTDMHDPEQKATNRISVVSWYQNNLEREFLLVKTVVSPLPCEEWGFLPLNLSQWRLIAPSLIASYVVWGWVHGVRQYADDKSFESGGLMGWHLDRCKYVRKPKGDPCTGQIIYRHVTDEFLQYESGA